MLLFLLYLAFYGGFVYLNAFRSDLMAKPSLGGINLATVYGLALIVVALVLDDRRWWIAAITASSLAMTGYTVLAFAHAYVP